MFNLYPYMNLNDLNLDYILNAIKEMRYEVTNFVSINAIKYADPIQWDIVRQYEKNTIVIDSITGTAYISVAPVPSGVALTRPEYWTVVFDLGSFVTKAAKNFTDHYEESTTLTATFNSNTGDWLVWGDVLYKALVNITAGDAYVVDSNIEHFTIEDVYNAYLNTIANILAMVGDLADLTTSDTSSIVNAINSVVTDYIAGDDAIKTIIGDLDDLNTTDKSDIVNAINEVNGNIGDLDSLMTSVQSDIVSALNEVYTRASNLEIINVKDLGAVGDGVTDDTDAIRAAFTAGDRVVYFPSGTYLISDTIYIQYSNTHIFGYGAILVKPVYTDNFIMFRVENQNADLYHVSIHGLEFDGKKPVGYASFDNSKIEPAVAIFGVVGYACETITLRDLYIHDNIGRGVAMSALTNPFQSTVKNVLVDGCRIVNTRHAIVQSIVTQTIVNNCFLDGSYDENYTCDNGCLSCKLVNTVFGERYLGSGCIGVDYAKLLQIIGCTIVGYTPYTGAGATPYGISFNTGVGVSERVIIANNHIMDSAEYGIIAHYDGGAMPLNNAAIIGNEFAGNTLGDIYIMASNTRIFINGNVYGSAGAAITVNSAYISAISECDAPIDIDISTFLQNGATITVPSLTKCYRLGRELFMCGKITPANNNIVFLQMPVGLRPSIAGYGNSKDCDVWYQVDGTINFEVSDLYDSVLGVYNPCTFTARFPVLT